MRATIITLAVAVLVTLGNITNVSGKNKMYSNTEIDPLTNTKTITVCEGKADIHLKPVSKSVKSYDENGNLIVKTLYKWNTEAKDWTPEKRHQYTVNNNTIESLQYSEWNEVTNSWKDNSVYIMYTYDSDGEYLSSVNDTTSNL